MRLLVTGGSGFIGTNLIESFAAETAILNYSLDPPLDSSQRTYWRQGDILDSNATRSIFNEFQPSHVIHLAARAECDENTTVEVGYKANTVGTGNVLDAIAATPSVERFIITSSQFVCAPGRLPQGDSDYYPNTVYGQSKVITERLTREANLPASWTIVRPTNIWGPWHMRYRREFWRIVQSGLYLHPGRTPVMRCYGYVMNIAHQMRKIFEAPRDLVNGQTLYLGDRPTDLFNWVNGFSRALRGHDARVVPRNVMRILALLGDIPSAITGKPFFINSSRFCSMTQQYMTPMDRTFELLGENPYTLDQGIEVTVRWLRNCRQSGALGGGS
jgi:nucleoside-diphosphate-sugar epimerase